MDNKKFETLIDLIINEDEEKARALFHDIVVEKSREIYESIMEEEAIEEAKEEDEEDTVEESKEEDEEDTIEESFDEMDEMSMDEVGGLMDEVSADESGMAEEEEFADIEVDDEDGLGDDEGDHGEMKDELLNIEDKLDELMAEFEELMTKVDGGAAGDEEGEEGGEEDFGGEEEMGDEEMMEAVQLQKVSVTHGDNGQNTKSIVSGGPKVSGNGAAPVKAFGGDEKGGKAQAPKDVKGAGQFKNAPGGKKADLEAAPKAKHGDDGQNAKSPVAESKKTTKKIVK